MGYRIESGDVSVEAAVRRIAAEQIEAAVAAIEDPDAKFRRTIHRVRTTTKRIRALLRLVRPVFGGYDAANEHLRTTAARLGPARDATIMLQNFDAAVTKHGGRGKSALPSFRRTLAEEEAAAIAEAREGAYLDFAHDRLDDLGRQAAEWKIDADGFAAFRPGLLRTCRQAVRDRARSEAKRTDEVFHVWRRRIKDHGFHVRLIENVDPYGLPPRSRALTALGDVLGTHHDIAVLCGRLSAIEDGEETLSPLLAKLAARQKGIEDAALDAGAVLFEEPCKQRLRRWRAGWDRWRGAAVPY